MTVYPPRYCDSCSSTPCQCNMSMNFYKYPLCVKCGFNDRRCSMERCTTFPNKDLLITTTRVDMPVAKSKIKKSKSSHVATASLLPGDPGFKFPPLPLLFQWYIHRPYSKSNKQFIISILSYSTEEARKTLITHCKFLKYKYVSDAVLNREPATLFINDFSIVDNSSKHSDLTINYYYGMFRI